jgi:hypothetical protein
MKQVFIWLAAVLWIAGCGSSPLPTYTIGGTVTGLNGTGLQLNNRGDNLTLSTTGNFTFEKKITRGSTYFVTVGAAPACHTQTCTVANGAGDAFGNVTNIAVTCVDAKITLVTTSWGDNAIRITPDIHSLANGATATPAIVQGSNTTLPSLGLGNYNMTSIIDRMKNIIYVRGSLATFANITTASGNILPTASFNASVSAVPASSSIDSTRDRLYSVGTDGNIKLWVFANASTLNGTTTPTTTISLSAPQNTIFIDSVHDRLFLGNRSGVITVYDSASALTSSSTPSRTITFMGYGSSANQTSIWVDTCTDRLYTTDRNGSSAGNNVFVFSSASTLTGSVNLDSGSVGRYALTNAENVMVDGVDALYSWIDSATAVDIRLNSSSLTGAIGAPSATINAVVNDGYGLDYFAN